MNIFGADEENLRRKLLLIHDLKWRHDTEHETLNGWVILIDPKCSRLAREVVNLMRDLKMLVPAGTVRRQGVDRTLYERKDDHIKDFFSDWSLYKIIDELAEPIWDFPGMPRRPEYGRKRFAV